jgi:hypothetical protein
MIPGLNDHEMVNIIGEAARVGAKFAGYVPLRLPFAVKNLFENWLENHFPNRKDNVLNRIRAMRGGQLNDSTFGSRMRGDGIFAEQLNQMFHVACRKAGFSDDNRPLLTAENFRRPAGHKWNSLYKQSACLELRSAANRRFFWRVDHAHCPARDAGAGSLSGHLSHAVGDRFDDTRGRHRFWRSFIRGLGSAAFFPFIGVIGYMLSLTCMFSGAQLSADAVSKEKREGTLGLLFLTGLRPWQIIGGKLIANGLSAFSGVMVTFPLLSLLLICGGVQPMEIFQICIALLNTLFVSAAMGLLISTVSLEQSARPDGPP